jgi:hypothetical protein
VLRALQRQRATFYDLSAPEAPVVKGGAVAHAEGETQ